MSQSDLSRHVATNEEFADLKPEVLQFSGKKNDFAHMDQHLKALNG